MNKEEIIKEVIDILYKSDYIDLAEHLYDGLKRIKREITLNTVHDFLWALESSTVIDVDGKVSACIEKIKPLLDYMNKERYQEIIDEVYRNYADSHWIPSLDAKPKEEPTMITDWLNEYGDPEIYKKVERELELREKESFIHEIKTNPEFSEKWGLKIEERELSLEERHQIHTDNVSKLNGRPMYVIYDGPESERVNFYDEENIPTKLITVTYKEEKIEVYD